MNVSPIRKKLTVRNKNVEATRNLKGKVKLPAKNSKPTKKLQIYQDEKTENSVEDQLTAEKTPEVYWKNLAEERRIALEKALEENKDLSELLQTRNEELKELQDENSVLVEENEILREKAQKVNELESLIAELIPTEVEDDREAEEEEPPASPSKRLKSD